MALPTEEPLFEKIHVRGVDELTTKDIKRFASEHFKEEEPARVEWIDDTSANLIYGSTDVGLRALTELTQLSGHEDISLFPSLQLRTAKPLSTHPESVLQVRSAVLTDRKRPRAHEASRFYLMHPEHDPRERMRSEFSERRQRGRRDGSSGEYRRRRFDDEEHQRRKANGDNFTSSMYDDNQESGRDDSSKGNYEIFPSDSDRSRGRLRDRSASPDKLYSSRDRTKSRRRFRERSPRTKRDRELFSRVNANKELFPSETNSSDEGAGRRELFPSKPSSSLLKKELFPSKPNTSNHRRSDAIDSAAADETADLFASRITIPLMDSASDASGRSGKKGSSNVRLFSEKDEETGLNIRGTASENQGMSIRGTSNGISIKGAASVRELFPHKFTGNEGKELFSDSLQGRGGRRRKAEDMFY